MCDSVNLTVSQFSCEITPQKQSNVEFFTQFYLQYGYLPHVGARMNHNKISKSRYNF